MTKFKTAIAIAVGSLFAGAAFAQSNYPIEQRDRFQDERIERGIQSGQLTSREADRLQSERTQVERIERRARADGVLTQFERARIDRAQDRLGRDIYRESNDRQVAQSNGYGSDRPYGWDRRNGMEQRRFDRGFRSERFNNHAAVRAERNEWRGNGVSTRTGTDFRFGRSDMAPGRQPHLQQTEAQRTQVQQAQTQRTWTRPAQASGSVTAASQVQPQRTWTRPAQASRTTTATSTVTVARQGGYSGRHTQ